MSNSQSKTGLIEWMNKLNNADWTEPSDIISTYNSADTLGSGTNRVVFNIGGNKYRMICEYFFGSKKIHLYIYPRLEHMQNTQNYVTKDFNIP